MDERTEKFLQSKNESTRRAYERGFELFRNYAKKEHSETITGESLIRIAAEDRRKDIEERERPEINLLKGFFNYLHNEAEKKGGEKGYALKSCHKYLSSITEFLNYNDLPVNKKKLSLPKATRKQNNRKLNIRRNQVRRLVNHAKTSRDKAVILCLWQSGMSIGDLLDMNVGDVMVEDPIRGSLDDPPLLIKLARKKSGVEYRSFFGRDACAALKQYLEERERTQGNIGREAPLFTEERKKRNGNGKYRRVKKSAVCMVFRRLALRSGIISEEKMEEADFNPARPHSLRSGFSSVLKEEGVNQSIIDGLTGHSISYDSAYHNFTDKQLRELYQEHEDVLSIEATSVPHEDEIKKAVKKHFGEAGAEGVMPELREKVEEQGSEVEELREESEEQGKKIEKLERELERQRGLMEIFSELLEEKPEVKEKFEEIL